MSEDTNPAASRPARIAATRVRINALDLEQIRPGSPLYLRAVAALEDRRAYDNYVQRASRIHGREGEIEVDDDAEVSAGCDNGVYVQGWLWVPDEEENEDDA